MKAQAPGPHRGSSDEVYALLRRRITLGEYGPGDRLKELALAQELAISRTPIRAAFQRLEKDGLVIAEPRRGVAVAPWTDRDNDEVFDLRAHLESHAAALAAQRRSESDLAELERLNAQLATINRYRSGDFRTEFEAVNRQFHQCIVLAARAPRLAQFVASLIDVRRVTGAFFHYDDAHFESSIQDHIAITRAISRGNGELARNLMDDHIRSSWQRLRLQRRNQPSPGAA
ncbi:MAG: GntR family transcriptional regulator [Comamonas sp.]